MAEGLIRHLMPEKIREIVTVSSAGTDAFHGNQASVFAIEAMERYGIDISGHRARKLNRPMVAAADLILTMEKHHLNVIRSMIFFGSGKAHLLSSFDNSREPYTIPDPMGGGPDLYLESARLIHNCIEGIHFYLEKNIGK